MRRITTTSAAVTLITKGSSGRGNIKKILITNISANNAIVSLKLRDAGGTDYWFLVNQNIPPKTPLLLEDCLSFDSSVYTLRYENSGTGPDVTIMII